MTTEQEALKLADALDAPYVLPTPQALKTKTAAMLRKLVAEREALKHDVETLKHGIEYVERRSDAADKQYLELAAEREEYRAAMRRALDALEAANAELRSIGDIAHDASTGPAVWDTYWNIRNAAYNAMDDAAITDLRQRLEGTT